MGTLRYILAVLVLLSHAGFNIGGHHPGVMAVAVFYALSGYVMAALISGHYASGASAVPRFYLDRLLRIYPQYAVYAVATAVWYALTLEPTAFMQRSPEYPDVLNNVLVFPLNYYMYTGADQFTLIPPAWSLGAELAFYLLAPWLWRHWRAATVLGGTSLVVQVLAWHGVLHSDWWGYRLLPGVLWVFLLGMGMYRLQATHRDQVSLVCAWLIPIAGALSLAYLSVRGLLVRHYTLEVVMGVSFAVPAIYILTRYRPSAGWRRMDDQLGNISYGVFLNHFLLMWLFSWQAPLGAGALLALVVASTLLSTCTFHFVENPVLHWRRRLRQP